MRGVVTALLLVAGLALFLSLGFWQLQRLEWKEGIIAEIDARIAGAAQDIPTQPDPAHDRYLPVALNGAFEPGGLHVLASTRDLGAGHRVISAFEDRAAGRILVDRGFVRTGSALGPWPGGQAAFSGNLHWPDERDGSTPENDVAGNIWFARDVEQMAALLGTRPVLVVAREATHPAITPLPITSEAVRNKHLEYAVTWFLFAGTWVMMTGYALWRIRRAKT